LALLDIYDDKFDTFATFARRIVSGAPNVGSKRAEQLVRELISGRRRRGIASRKNREDLAGVDRILGGLSAIVVADTT